MNLFPVLSITVPLLTALAAALLKGTYCRTLLLSGSLLHLAFILKSVELRFSGRWIGLTSEYEATLLLLTSLLYLAVTVYCAFWLKAEETSDKSKMVLGICLPLFLSTMTLVLFSQNYGIMWVAIEATTLFSAPLILFHRSGRALEAMWKYLLICSVGIGLALLGTLFLAFAARNGGVVLHDLQIAEFLKIKNSLDPGWYKAAFVLALAGYGTKMGLAPFHTWLPDAHSEAPGAVSALLSAGLLNCSFVGIIRFATAAPAALGNFCSNLLIVLGVISLATAAFFIIHQGDFKRMLAYSSIEHMGIAAIIFALCGMDLTIAHLCAHSAIKMALFLLAGNLLLACGTRQVGKVSGLFTLMPRNAILFLTGTLLICGVPPSPLFVTELKLLCSAPLWLALTVAVLLFIVFAGMTKNVLAMTMGKQGEAEVDAAPAEKLIWVPAAGLIAALVLAVYFWTEFGGMLK
ncbi:MAG: hypothetical protein E7048_11330 [Lentisphaerae bacterium]|nr:hypothetical protein [Lentisphaerota bacterium]